MLIATTEEIAGRRTTAAFGFVLGIAVRRRGIGNGGALGEFGDELAAVRREAVAQMAARAAELGANAVVGVRFDTAEVGHDMVEIVAYGSAVAVAPG